MAIITYAELIDALVLRSKRSDIETSVIPDAITYAHQEINRTLRANVMLASADLTINAETISQPTGFLAFKRLYLDLTPRRDITVTSAEGALDLSARYSSGTYPAQVAVEGTLLRFAPLFTGSATGKALYYKEATEMSDDSDTNVVLAKYPFLYVWGALSDIFDYLEDVEQQTLYEGKFRGLIADINKSEAADTMAGPIQGAPYPGGVV